MRISKMEERKACVEENKLSRSKVVRLPFPIFGFISVEKGRKLRHHDIFSKGKYGDMDAFLGKLKDMGYQEVELIDTTDGVFFKDGKEAKHLLLQHSKLLKGIK